MIEPVILSPDVTLYHGDCLEVMPTLPPQSVDLILADLPYGTTSCQWDSVIPLDCLWAQYERLIKPTGAIVLHATQPFTTILIASNLPLYKYSWVWRKNRPGNVFNAKNAPLKIHEDICVFSKGTTANKSPNRMGYNPQGLVQCNLVRNNAVRSGEDTIGNRPSRQGQYKQTATGYPMSVLEFSSDTGLHPTQKPKALEEYLIRTYTNEGGTVLDNTMGSGTTGVAAVESGRRFVGIEKDDKFFSTASNRINAALAQRNANHA